MLRMLGSVPSCRGMLAQRSAPATTALNSITRRALTSGSSATASDPRQSAEREAGVLEALKKVTDKSLQSDLVSLGMIKFVEVNGTSVKCHLQLSSPAFPDKDEMKADCEKAILGLPWASDANVKLVSKRPISTTAKRGTSLYNVANIIAVTSCKGGVGKSTVSVNLAYTLSAMGAKVGILDADIFGPSLPTLVNLPSHKLIKSAKEPRWIEPLEFNGVKLMSAGFAKLQGTDVSSSEANKTVLRGPMVSRLVQQLIEQVDWGELDYLIVDMPPGTGDIQITLCQQMSFAGAVVVTTPQRLSLIDVVKGIDMFQDLKVPTLGVVENMSHFDTPAGERYYPFGKGHLQELQKTYDIKNSFTLPIMEAITNACDDGTPLPVSDPESPVSNVFRKVADCVLRELHIMRHNESTRPNVFYSEERGKVVIIRFFFKDEAEEFSISASHLRKLSPAADNSNPEDVSDKVFPMSIEHIGNYAVSIDWSDGHKSSIYTYELLRDVAVSSRNEAHAHTHT